MKVTTFGITVLALLATIRGRRDATLFEATSAFGTVGLSTGAAGAPVSLSGEFATPGRLLICLLMFVGRIGPLTLAFALAGRHRASHVRYPEERVPTSRRRPRWCRRMRTS